MWQNYSCHNWQDFHPMQLCAWTNLNCALNESHWYLVMPSRILMLCIQNITSCFKIWKKKLNKLYQYEKIIIYHRILISHKLLILIQCREATNTFRVIYYVARYYLHVVRWINIRHRIQFTYDILCIIVFVV